MNVIIWARVSSREQREGYSIDAQLRLTRERADKNGWTVIREFQVAESAKTGIERTAFNEMFAWVKKNAKKEKIHAILAHKLDRVCRNMRDAVRLQELENEIGVQLAFVDNQFGPGAAGALSFNVMAAVAQYYSDNLRTEVLKGMQEKVKQGWPMGHASFGYMNTQNKECPIVPHPENSATVIRIFDLYATGKYTFEHLKKVLSEEGRIYQKTRPPFYRGVLSYILNNRAYIGEIQCGDHIYPAKFQPLISRQIWNICQEHLHGKNRRTGNPEIPFSGGVFRCAYCGAAMTGERKRRKLSGGGCSDHIYYRCGNDERTSDHPTRVRWKFDELDAAVLKELESMRIPNQQVATHLRSTLEKAFADVEAAEAMRRRLLGKRLTEVDGMLQRLLNAYLEGMIEERTMSEKQSALKAEKADLENQLAAKRDWDPKRAELALKAFDFSQNVADLWRRSNWAQKRDILAAISSNHAISTSSVCLTKRKPFGIFVEGPFLNNGRPDCLVFKPKEMVMYIMETMTTALNANVLETIDLLGKVA